MADAVNDAIRVVGSDGLIRTLVGPQPGTSNGARSPLRFPTGLSIAPGGGVLVADAGHRRVVLRDPAGRVSVVAGDGAVGYAGDGGPARRAQLSGPMAVASAPDGEMLVRRSTSRACADRRAHRGLGAAAVAVVAVAR